MLRCGPSNQSFAAGAKSSRQRIYSLRDFAAVAIRTLNDISQPPKAIKSPMAQALRASYYPKQQQQTQ